MYSERGYFKTLYLSTSQNPLYFSLFNLFFPSFSLQFTPMVQTVTESSLFIIRLRQKAGFFSTTTCSYVLCSKCKVLPVNSNSFSSFFHTSVCLQAVKFAQYFSPLFLYYLFLLTNILTTP